MACDMTLTLGAPGLGRQSGELRAHSRILPVRGPPARFLRRANYRAARERSPPEGNYISDPRNANRGPYTDFCTFMVVMPMPCPPSSLNDRIGKTLWGPAARRGPLVGWAGRWRNLRALSTPTAGPAVWVDTGVMRYLSIDTSKKISKIGLGTWQFGSREWGYGDRYADQVAQAIVRRALELGVTLFDTAEIYGFGRSERILGQALGEDRERIFLATKILPVLPVAPVVEQRAVASANRLGARSLDLYQVHQANPLVRDGTIMRGMRALQHVGLVGEVGVSNYSLQRWRAAEDALGSRVLSNQIPYSLVARSPERDILPYAQAGGRVVLAYSPLAQGVLSGRYDQDNRPANRVRAGNPLFLPDNLARAAELIAALRGVAEEHSATPAQIALAWVIRHPAVAAIPGASSVEQLEHNAAAADIDLTDGQYQALAAAAAGFQPITGTAAIPRLARARFGH